MEQSILNLQHLSKSFDGKKILDDLSIDIGKNEFVTLLGPSGCGKTTTLRIIGGFVTPDEGSVIFEGKDITDLPPDRRNINTVFQKYSLFSHMSVGGECRFRSENSKSKSEVHILQDKIKVCIETGGSGGIRGSSSHGFLCRRTAAEDRYCQGHCQRAEGAPAFG